MTILRRGIAASAMVSMLRVVNVSLRGRTGRSARCSRGGLRVAGSRQMALSSYCHAGRVDILYTAPEWGEGGAEEHSPGAIVVSSD